MTKNFLFLICASLALVACNDSSYHTFKLGAPQTEKQDKKAEPERDKKPGWLDTLTTVVSGDPLRLTFHFNDMGLVVFARAANKSERAIRVEKIILNGGSEVKRVGLGLTMKDQDLPVTLQVGEFIIIPLWQELSANKTMIERIEIKIDGVPFVYQPDAS